MQKSLTEGPIVRTVVSLALPITAASFLNTIYSITDMAWIGTLGAKAVAGVGAGSMYVWLSSGLASLARMGGQVNVAQSIGRGNREEAKEYAKCAVQMVLLFAFLFSAVCLIFTKPLVGFFKLTDEISISYGLTYLRITCGLIGFSYLTQVLTGIHTAQGDSKTPLKANAVGLVINMVMDPMLILGIGPFPRLEVFGAAMATVSAQAIVVAAMLVHLMMQKPEENVLKNIRWLHISNKNYYKNIGKIGGPTAIQGMLYCGFSMVLARMASFYGTAAIAVMRLGGQIEAVSWNTADGFAAAINAFSGQNYGARKPERIKKGYLASVGIILAWGIFITFVFVFLPRPIANVFFHEEDVIQIAIRYFVIVGLSQAFMSVELVTIGALAGLGKTKLCSAISIPITGSRILIAYLLASANIGSDAIWWALSSTSILKGIIFPFVYFKCFKGISQQIKER